MMKAIELKYKTDEKGKLNIEYQLDRSNSDVRVLILIEDESFEEDEMNWMKIVSDNPAFEFLKDDSEDIYTLTDGEPITT